MVANTLQRLDKFNLDWAVDLCLPSTATGPPETADRDGVALGNQAAQRVDPPGTRSVDGTSPDGAILKRRAEQGWRLRLCGLLVWRRAFTAGMSHHCCTHECDTHGSSVGVPPRLALDHCLCLKNAAVKAQTAQS